MSKPNDYQRLIHATRYARWLEDEGRRETYEETCRRYVDFWVGRDQLKQSEADELYKDIFNMRAMPSMRAMWSAGPALEQHQMASYNCSYVALDHPRAFDEMLYILCCGTGVGFSCEDKFVSKLPEIAEDFHPTDTVIKVHDSKIGWAKAFKQLLAMLWQGEVPQWDVSAVRPAGARLKTFGGRASGPQPLVDLFVFATGMFTNAAGRRLTSIEAHDLACKVGDIVVVGGVRRSALISLSTPVDDYMREAKSGRWFETHPHRALANNSACYNHKPEFPLFLKEVQSLYTSFSGERGFFSREAAKKIAARNGRRDPNHDFGTNPCSEIILRSAGVCNLSEVIIREGDSLATLKKKVETATIFGTLQATLNDFRYVRSIWKKNTEERLLGVSLTGIMDHKVMAGLEGDEKLTKWLNELRDHAIEVNKKWAKRLGIEQSAAITCVKPSGTVSQLCDTASGIHPRFSPYYVRTVRQDDKDPITDFLRDYSHNEPAIGKEGSTTVFHFFQKAPEGAVCTEDVGAMEQLRLWKLYQDEWCEHKPSITVFYTPDEFMHVAAWMWDNFDSLSGISLLPYDGGTYQQAPYQQITEEQYEAGVVEQVAMIWNGHEMVEDRSIELPPITRELPVDWSKLVEQEDTTVGAQTLACTGSACEL
jgi:ribonucleoside-diphosphate reductase alpha chain